MSMQIHVDPAGLTQEQREAVAGFILAYPAAKSCGGTCQTVAFTGDPFPGTAVAEIHANTEDGGAPLDAEIAQLVKEDGEFQASVAFGSHGSAALDADAVKLNAIFGQGAAGATLGDVGLAPAAAFGSAPAPLPPGATVAPPPAASIPPAPAPSTVAPPPVVNTAPTTTMPGAVSSAAPAASVELDKDGLPWDSRIHVESKNKNTDGRWRNKRNLDPAVKAKVEAELRQLMGAPAPLSPAPVVAASPVAPTSQVAAQPAAFVAPNPPGAVPPPPVAGAAPVMQAAPNTAPGEVPQDARQQFVALVGRASAAIQGGKVTQAEVNQCCADSGVPALPLLANRLDLVATVAAKVDALIAARG